MEKSETITTITRPGKVVVSDVVEEDKEDDSNTSEGQTETVLPPAPVEGTQSVKEVPIETCLAPVEPEETMEQETENKEDTDCPEVVQGKEETKDQEQDPQMETTPAPEEKEGTPMVTVSREMEEEEEEEEEEEKKEEEGDGNNAEQKTNGSDEGIAKETENSDVAVNGKRKAESTVETSPSKKTKLINDGFCLFVGNLNTSKKYEEVTESLASYFMTQSLLVQGIRLDSSRKFAYVDLASEMDLTKALKLNGEKILDKPMRIGKAKVKDAVKVKVKPPPEDKKDKDARCLFLKNIPYTATKENILTVFEEALGVRFPGGTEGPSKGIAFVEFKTEAIAEEFLKSKQGAKIQDRVLIVESVGEKSSYKPNKASAEAAPSNTLIVKNLAYKVTEKALRKVFDNAVSIDIPLSNGKSSGFAFVEFATVDDAKEAMESSQNTEIFERAIRVDFCSTKPKAGGETVPSKTLIVMGLTKDTSMETLKSAFEGAINARVATDMDTGISRGFGFVDFESQEDCNAAKEAMEDCEIDGRKVTVDYARPKGERGPPGVRRGFAGGFRGQLGDRGRGGGSRGRGGGSRGRGGSSRGGKGSSRGGRGGGPGKNSQDGVKGGKVKG